VISWHRVLKSDKIWSILKLLENYTGCSNQIRSGQFWNSWKTTQGVQIRSDEVNFETPGNLHRVFKSDPIRSVLKLLEHYTGCSNQIRSGQFWNFWKVTQGVQIKSDQAKFETPGKLHRVFESDQIRSILKLLKNYTGCSNPIRSGQFWNSCKTTQGARIRSDQVNFETPGKLHRMFESDQFRSILKLLESHTGCSNQIRSGQFWNSCKTTQGVQIRSDQVNFESPGKLHRLFKSDQIRSILKVLENYTGYSNQIRLGQFWNSWKTTQGVRIRSDQVSFETPGKLHRVFKSDPIRSILKLL